MLKILLKKQLAEVFKSYFYNSKKNKMRSKLAIGGFFVFFFILMVGVLGGISTFLSINLCSPLVAVNMGWLYFLIMANIAILLGAFGSIFNTYAGLYLAKDNDLLLSMPIPVGTIMTARLLNVYLMGTMYSITALLPALIVYWVIAGPTVSRIVCGIILLIIVTAFVLILSCLLGWVVAKISLRLKNKSFITVIASLVFIGAYYFFYFKANTLLQDLIQNAEIYGENIKGAVGFLYQFGRIGEGAWVPAILFLALTVLLLAAVWIILSRTFLGIATSSGHTERIRYVRKSVTQKTIFGALLSKEFSRFTSNANYMLNCGLGVLLIPASGVLLLIKGRQICEVLESVFESRPDIVAIFVCTMLFMIASMNDMAVPSVSLEGKSLWILQSMPVPPKKVLLAKASVQLILTGIPMLFAVICSAVIVNASLPVKLLLFFLPLVYTLFSTVYSIFIGIKMPILNWTNEITPIKQSGAILIVLFSSWAFSIAFGGLYMLIGYRLGSSVYMLLWLILFAAASLLMLLWLIKKGGQVFAELS